MFSATSLGPGRVAPAFPFSSQITLANISTKAAPTERFGTPVLGQQTAPPLAVPSACASPPAARDCSRPSGSPGSGRVPAGPPAAPEQAGPCRWLGSGPGYLQGQAMLGDRCQARLRSHEGFRNSLGRRRFSCAVVLAICITRGSCNTLSSPLPSHTETGNRSALSFTI